MLEFKAYQCESCREIYKNKNQITICKKCGKEICVECSAFSDKLCWECDEKINYEEDDNIILTENIEERMKKVLDDYEKIKEELKRNNMLL